MVPLPERDPHRPHIFFELQRGKQTLGTCSWGPLVLSLTEAVDWHLQLPQSACECSAQPAAQSLHR